MSSTAKIVVHDATSSTFPRPRQPRVERAVPANDGGWAVVRIHQDGTMGPWTVVTAPDAVQVLQSVSPGPRADDPTHADPQIALHLGRLHASQGHHREAVKAMTLALAAATTTSLRHRCLAELALVEAYMGRLRSSAEHDVQAEHLLPGAGGNALALARAWRLLAQGELDEAGRSLELVEPTLDVEDDRWSGTVHTLVRAELLMATGRPDAASRVLADTPPIDGDTWSAGVLRAARADALLQEGEQHRALAVLTPLPEPAAAEAGVVAADARAAIGDMRGAQAVLAAVVDLLDLAPTPVQVRAWILEARLEQHRGNSQRSRLLVDRALLAASTEGMRTPLRRDGRWLRATADRDVSLLHAHRELLTSLGELARATPTPLWQALDADGTTVEMLGAALTEREAQVLELLAEMYSTEEIAAALFVSSNTVKTHLKGIFGKLCVNRRVDAVRRGRQLGLC